MNVNYESNEGILKRIQRLEEYLFSNRLVTLFNYDSVCPKRGMVYSKIDATYLKQDKCSLCGTDILIKNVYEHKEILFK